MKKYIKLMIILIIINTLAFISMKLYYVSIERKINSFDVKFYKIDEEVNN